LGEASRFRRKEKPRHLPRLLDKSKDLSAEPSPHDPGQAKNPGAEKQYAAGLRHRRGDFEVAAGCYILKVYRVKRCRHGSGGRIPACIIISKPTNVCACMAIEEEQVSAASVIKEDSAASW
jgi:hypothetical protein